MNKIPKVLGIMSMPRLAFTDNMRCVSMLSELDIPLITSSGCYWDRSLQKCFDHAIKEGYDYVLTIDYDSIFTKRDVQILLSTAVDENIGALAPLMRGREDVGILYNTSMPEVGEIIPVDTAHFGLTVIDVNVLKDIGDYWVGGNINVHPDMQFWEDLKEEEHQAYIHKGVSVGHLTLMVSNVDGSFSTLDEWYTNEGDKDG